MSDLVLERLDAVLVELGALRSASGMSEVRQDKAEAILSRIETTMMHVRTEVHELGENVSRSNVINLETQSELIKLRRETENGFHDVHDSLVSTHNQLLKKMGLLDSKKLAAVGPRASPKKGAK